MCLFSFFLKWDHSSHRTFIESEIFYNLKMKWNILHASFSLLAKMEGYISLKNSALRHCVGVLKSWFKLQKQNYWVFLLAVNPSFLVLLFFSSSAFLVICSEMFFKPLFAFAKHSVNWLLSWKFVMHLSNPICIQLGLWEALLIL